MDIESAAEQARRAWVERQERFRDRGEEYDRSMTAAENQAARDRLMQDFSAYRTAHLLEDVAAGKRPSGESVMMRQIMWARWIEIAVASELQAREEFRWIVSTPGSGALTAELRSSLVCISACAHTIEALYGDIKYLIPAPNRRRDTRDRRLIDGLTVAFGLSDGLEQRLRSQLAWLFELRDFAVHPYTELEVSKPHPAGMNTGAEAARFNAVKCGEAVDLTMRVLGLARRPPAPYGRWIERWTQEREPYHISVIEPLERSRGAAPTVP